MAKCEIWNIDCPTSFHESCETRIHGEDLLKARKLLEENGFEASGSAIQTVENELGEVFDPRCRLEEALIEKLNLKEPELDFLNNLTDKQLATAGVKHLD